MSALERLEAERDAALASLSEESSALRILNEEEERFLKQVHKKRLAIDKAKSAKSKAVQDAQAKLDALEAKVPREVVLTVSEHQSRVNQLDFELRGHERELVSTKYAIEQQRKKGAKSDELTDIIGQVMQLEVVVSETQSDLAEARASLEAAQVLRREALESAARELAAV